MLSDIGKEQMEADARSQAAERWSAGTARVEAGRRDVYQHADAEPHRRGPR
jgi:hypothetical protein